MKQISKLLTAMMLFLSLSGFAQSEWFISFGLDPAVLVDKGRAGGGNLNYLIQFGRENYTNDGLGYKFGGQWEQFEAINYTSYGAFGGMTFEAPWGIGHYWIAMAEINIIDRKGIQDSQIYNASKHSAWGLGATVGIRVEEPDLWLVKLPIDIEFLLNGKDRPDKRVHYDGGTFDSINDIVFSFYLTAVFNF